MLPNLSLGKVLSWSSFLDSVPNFCESRSKLISWETICVFHIQLKLASRFRSLIEIEGTADGSDMKRSLQCLHCQFFLPVSREIKDKRKTQSTERCRARTPSQPKHNMWFATNPRRQWTKQKAPSDLELNHLPDTLWFPSLWGWGKGKRIKTASKWLSLIHSLNSHQKPSKLLPTTMLSFPLPRAKTSFPYTTAGMRSPSKFDKCRDARHLCPIHLGSHLLQNEFSLSSFQTSAALPPAPSFHSHQLTCLSRSHHCSADPVLQTMRINSETLHFDIWTTYQVSAVLWQLTARMRTACCRFRYITYL